MTIFSLIKAMHVEGSAFKSGRIKTGDTLVSVDGQIIGADNLLAGKLVRCGPPTPPAT